MTIQMTDTSVVTGMFWLLVAGGLIAWGSCLWSNYLDRRAGLDGEAPSWLTSGAGVASLVAVLLVVSQSVLSADVIQDPCSVIDPNESWAAWLLWLAAGCGWAN